MEQTPESELSKSARRAVETTLQLLDEGLCRVEQWAEGRQRSSVLYTETNRLSPAQRNALLREVAAMRRALRASKDALGLVPRDLNAARDIWALCSGLRVDLMELESKRLRGYGALSAAAATCIDETSHRLEAGLDRIVRILSSGAPVEEEP